MEVKENSKLYNILVLQSRSKISRLLTRRSLPRGLTLGSSRNIPAPNCVTSPKNVCVGGYTRCKLNRNIKETVFYILLKDLTRCLFLSNSVFVLSEQTSYQEIIAGVFLEEIQTNVSLQ